MFPTPDVAEHWSRHRGLELSAHRAWGLPLVVDGSVLRSAGASDFPGVFPDPAGPPLDPPEPPRGATAVVLHDVSDDEGLPDQVVRAYPRARVYLRYECELASFGRDPDAYCQATLSTKRRKRLRHDLRKLTGRGNVEVRWAAAAEAEDLFDAFFGMLCSRARSAHAYDANVLDRTYLRDLWLRFAGRELLVSVLSVGERPVSFRTGYAVGERFIGYLPAIDRSFSKASVGDLHMQLLMPDLVERGLSSYHMGKGSRGNKDVWANGSYSLSTIVVPLRPGRARGVVALEGARQRARRAVTANGWEQPLRRALHVLHTRPGATYGRTLARFGPDADER